MSVDLLEAAAAAFGDLLDQVVFLGGATIGLWITDTTARAPRVTYDVDVVAEVQTLGAYEAFQVRLREHGFREDVESGVMSRWRVGPSNLVDGGNVPVPPAARSRRRMVSLRRAVPFLALTGTAGTSRSNDG
jgi:hypothetical protein